MIMGIGGTGLRHWWKTDKMSPEMSTIIKDDGVWQVHPELGTYLSIGTCEQIQNKFTYL
jgi:hypothetical protein